MKFTVSKEVLQKEMGFVQGVIERKNTIPVLANVLIETAGEQSIRVTGTDLDVNIFSTFDVDDIVSSGSLCVPAKKLFDIVRLLNDGPVHFTQQENAWVKIKSGRAEFKVPGLEAGKFPEVRNAATTSFSVPALMMAKAIRRTMFAITQEEGRYTLSGAKLEIEKGTFRMITTDGHRLALFETPTEISEAVDVLIPRKPLGEILKLTAEAGEKDVISLGIDKSHLSVQVGERILVSRQLTGQFPNWQMVIPKGSDRKVECDASALLMAVRRATLMADGRSHSVKFSLSSTQGSTISATTPDEGESVEGIELDYRDENMEIGFNAAYVEDFLNTVPGERVIIDLKDGNSQAQFKPAGDSGYKCIIMPMRI